MADWYPLPGTLKGPPGEPGVVPGWVSVTEHGAAGDGSTDDTAAIQDAIDTSPTGSVVWFPPGTYLVSETIRLAPYRAYIGAGGRAQLTRIKAAAGLTGGALLAAAGWWNNATVCDNPIRVEGLYLDASSVAGTHGLVVYHFWSHFEDIQVGNIDGPNAAGILATDRGRDASTLTTNSHSENTFVRCRFLEHTGRATGFKVETHTSPGRVPPDGANQDGHILDSFFAGISGDAIRIQRAAGWSVENNHLYGIGYNGIALGNCYATKVQRNYIEDFGGADGANNGQAPTWGYFNGIVMETVLDTRASILAENTVSVIQPSTPAGNRWTCYSARAGGGQLLANLVAVGNTAVWASTSGPATSRAEAWRLGEGGDTGRLLAVEWAANQIQDVGWWQGRRVVAGGATVAITESTAPVASVNGRTGAVTGLAESTELAVKADDSAVVKLTGAQSVSGLKTFVNGVATAQPSAPNMAVRHDDARLSDTRTPTVHTHGAGEVTSGTFAIARIPTGTSGTTVALGNDARLSDARTPTAHGHAGTDITSGTVAYARLPVGTGAGTVAAGNDARLSDARTPTSHTHGTADITRTIGSQTSVGNGGTATPAAATDVDRFTTTGSSATLATPSGSPADGTVVNVEVYSTGSTTNLALAGGYTLTGGQTSPVAIPSGKVAHLALRYRGIAPAGWRVLAVSVDN